MSLRVLILKAISVFIFVSSTSHAKVDPFDLPQVVAVENKKFNPLKDVTAFAGVLPLDAFYKSVILGVSYTQAYNSFLSWEVINAGYAFNQDTNLKNDLVDNFKVKPQGILDSAQYMLTSHLVYTPIYSKNLLFNQDVIYGEWSLVAGGGALGYESGDIAALVGGGLIARFFKSERTSYKFDGRLYYQTAQNKSSDLILLLSLGMSFELGNSVSSAKVQK